MKAQVEYKPEIHKQLVESLNKEVEKSGAIQKKGVTVLEKKVTLPGGRQIVVGKELNKMVNDKLSYTFSYKVIKTGLIEIEFKSLADNIPLVKQYTEKAMKLKMRSELKKEFKDGILKVK
jgi:hypothetical protein